MNNVSFGTLNYIILFVYMALMLYIGIRLAGKQEDTEDLFLGGKKLPWLAVGMSFFASLFSAISYMGMPGVVYAENASFIVSLPMLLVVVPILVLVFYPFYRKLRLTTTYEYIGRRYGKPGRYAVSVLFLLARLGWLSVVIYVPSLAISTVCGLDLYLAIALMGAAAIIYTSIGGLAAVVWTDAAQFIILAGALIWVIWSVIHHVPGGVYEIFTIANETGKLGIYDWTLNFFKLTAVGIIISDFLSFMTDLGTDQIAVQRVLGVKDFKGVVRCTLFGGISGVVINAMLILAGLGLFAYFQTFPDRIAAGIDADKIFPYYVMHSLPIGISGLVITGIFAASMSSVSAGTNSVVTVLFNDLINPNRKIKRDKRYDLNLSRWLTVIVGAVCIGMAFYASSLEGIIKAVVSFLGMFGGPILVLFVLGMFTRRANFPGWAFATVISVGLSLYVQKYTELHWSYYYALSCSIGITVGYLASLVYGAIAKVPLADRALTFWGQRGKALADYGSEEEVELQPVEESVS